MVCYGMIRLDPVIFRNFDLDPAVPNPYPRLIETRVVFFQIQVTLLFPIYHTVSNQFCYK